jgi:thioesterase domain-containing protein/acyl carrier protein
MTYQSKSLPGGSQATLGEDSPNGLDLSHSAGSELAGVNLPQSGLLLGPAEPIVSNLVAWWRELLTLDSVGLDDDFLDIGGDSLLGAQLFSKIKKTYGLELGLSTLFEARTVRQLAELILQSNQPTRLEPRPWSPIVPIQPLGHRLPLFLIPGGYGTTVLPFREVSLLLGSDQPVYGFEAKKPAPEEKLESILERAARFTQELRAVQPKGPYCLIGWCGGGYIAFEIAQQLQKEGEAVAFLAIVECSVPNYPASLADKVRFMTQRATWRLRSFFGRSPAGMAQRIKARFAILANHVSAYFHAKGADSDDTQDPLLAALVDDMDKRAWDVVNRYRPVSYPGKSIVILGRDSWSYGGLSSSMDPRLAWCKLSVGGNEVHVVPGDHMEILKAPHSHHFAQELKDCLDHAVLPRS